MKIILYTLLEQQEMGKYKYKALDAQGKEVEGTIEEANSNKEAIDLVRNMGLFPTKVYQIGKHPSTITIKHNSFSQKELITIGVMTGLIIGLVIGIIVGIVIGKCLL